MDHERRNRRMDEIFLIVRHTPLTSVRIEFADVTPDTCELSDGENRTRTVNWGASQPEMGTRVSLMTDRLEAAGFDAPIVCSCNPRSP